VRSHWLQGSRHAPIKTPMATRPAGPIQLLSKAYFKKNETPKSSARMPMRLNQRAPMVVSRSSCSAPCDFEACSGGAAKTLTRAELGRSAGGFGGCGEAAFAAGAGGAIV